MKLGSSRCGALLVVGALTLCGCGSAHGGGTTTRRGGARGLLTGSDPQDSSAGRAVAYVPTGHVLADDGFRPAANGFGFENYGNADRPQNLTPAVVERFFGEQVCVSGTGVGTPCQLIPPAQHWMNAQNAYMAGGHCMGMSVTALRLFDHNLSLREFGGARTTYGLRSSGNRPLQEAIAEGWSFQGLPDVQRAAIHGPPVIVLARLVAALREKREYYTITIFKRDGSAGHAVTPYAVDELGSGRYAILVYDNNFPGITRAIIVDSHTDTWRYVSGPDPSDTSQLYEGDAATQTMTLLPTSPGLFDQPCPFCDAADINRAEGNAGVALRGAQRYDTIALIGNPDNHAHIVLRDRLGRRTGLVNGTQLNQIPGVTIEDNISDQNWRESPEPIYHVPLGTNVTAAIDGAALTRTVTEQLDLQGPGYDALIQGIVIAPGQSDSVAFTGGGTGYRYRTDPRRTQSPLLGIGVEGRTADYRLSVRALDIHGGSELAMRVDRSRRQLIFATGAGDGPRQYVLTVVREAQGRTSSWTDASAPLRLNPGALAQIDYGAAVDPTAPVRVAIHTAVGRVQTARIP